MSTPFSHTPTLCLHLQSVAQLAEAIIYGALPSTNDFTVSPSSLSTIAVNRAGSSFTGGEVTAPCSMQRAWSGSALCDLYEVMLTQCGG